MATIDNYKIKIQVDGQEQVVDLQENLFELQSTLNRTATAGIAAFTALATSAVRMADDMVDLANATGLSVGKIYQLSAALEASGGQFDDGGRLIQAFSRTLGQVEKGSQEAIDSLTKLGLSRQDIESLSDEQLFNAAVNGLANMENGFAKTEIAMQLFGKSAASIDFAKLAQELKGTVDPEVERNLLLAADAVGSIEVAFRNLQLAALQAITPILQAIADLEITGQDAAKFIQILGSLIAAAFAASVVIQMKKIIDLFKTMGAVIRGVATAQAFLTGLTGVGLVAVGAAAAAATAAYIALGKAVGDAADEKERLDGTAPTPAAGQGTAGRTVGITPDERALAAIKEQTRQIREKNVEANKYQRIINDTIGKSQQEITLIRTMADLERTAGNEKLSIQKQIDAELAKGADTNQAIVQELKLQLSEVDKQLAIQKQLKTEELERLRIEQERIAIIDYNVGQTKLSYDFIKTANEQFVQSLINQGALTEKQAARKIEIMRAEAAMNEKLYAMDAQIAKENDAIKKAILQKEFEDFKNSESKKIEFIKNRFALEDELQQSVMAGTVKALEQITNQFTPYMMAQDAILTTWNKIGSAVDTFIQTGKFKFSDFAKSVLRDLAAIIIKAQILKAVSATLGFFGIKLPGLAQGGPASPGQPYIVGEKGPELFVPKQAGTVIPNNKLMASQGMTSANNKTVNAPVNNTYITNNISALDAKSVAQLFAENRKTLLGSVQMAQREMPYAGR